MTQRGSLAGRLTVVSGGSTGSTYPVRPGSVRVGRFPEMDVVLPDPTVSGTHAELVHAGRRASVRDLGATNGTYVNGHRVRGEQELHDGDVLRLGGVELRYSAAVATDDEARGRTEQQPEDARSATTVGDVHGPVQTGAGNQWVAGRDQHIAGRDQYVDHSWTTQNDYDPWDEIWQGHGPGRWLMIVGGFLALAGFATWMVLILSGMTGDPFEAPDPFARELIDGVPLAAAAFAAFVAGGVLAGIGGGMSKAARKREEQRLREQGRWR